MKWSIPAGGSLFDMNGDGKLDLFEQSTEMRVFFEQYSVKKTPKSRKEEIEEALEELCCTLEDLQAMDPDDAREILEDAGIIED